MRQHSMKNLMTTATVSVHLASGFSLLQMLLVSKSPSRAKENAMLSGETLLQHG